MSREKGNFGRPIQARPIMNRAYSLKDDTQFEFFYQPQGLIENSTYANVYLG